MKLVVGLGNPGREYEKTRHNIGFMVLDLIASKLGKDFDKSKFNGLYFIHNYDGEKVIFLKPQKYMNLSGEVIAKFIEYYDIDINDILIICDDLSLPVGKIRLRPKGSSGGHNGLKNISLNLKSEEYKRLKIGISNNKLINTKNYVLGKFSKDEMEILDRQLSLASLISLEFITKDFSSLMNNYN